jgi:hypothetical protein
MIGNIKSLRFIQSNHQRASPISWDYPFNFAQFYTHRLFIYDFYIWLPHITTFLDEQDEKLIS